MDDESLSPMAGQALARLRALAQGNGLDPQAIQLMAHAEKVYTLEGIMNLTPSCETETKAYDGAVRAKGAQMLGTFEMLRNESNQRQRAFQGQHDWVKTAYEELRKMPGEGWGLDGAKIILPDRSVTLAANESCEKCKGHKLIACQECQARGVILCTQCFGQKQEFCYNCNGTAVNPSNHAERCIVCQETPRYVMCRLCHGRGETVCRICHGKRNTPCPTCRGVGLMSEEIHLTFGATTHFGLKTDDLPSAMRRGLDRLGLPNLAKGHADISIVTPKKEDEEHIEPDMRGVGGPPQPKPSEQVLHYRAMLPFADLRVDFGGKKTAIGIFGKRQVFVDVPAFLDESLKPWLEKLKLVIKGKAPIDDALEARALKEAVSLILQRKGIVKELRRLYPVGLSATAAENILKQSRRALKRFTLGVRAIAAGVSGILSAGIFGVCFFTPFVVKLVYGMKWGGYILDFAPLITVAVLDWLIMHLATGYFLRRHFPQTKISLKQHAGKIEYGMLAAVVVMWVVLLALSPVRPGWLPSSFH